jgi:hypothetical protein
MDKVDVYRKIIMDLISDYKLRVAGCEGLETYLAVDRDGDHYQVLRDGWRNDYRFYGAVLHFDIKDGKVWIRHDGTEDAMAERLVERGVPREDIVLAFHPPYVRKHTAYAAG